MFCVGCAAACPPNVGGKEGGGVGVICYNAYSADARRSRLLPFSFVVRRMMDLLHNCAPSAFFGGSFAPDCAVSVFTLESDCEQIVGQRSIQFDFCRSSNATRPVCKSWFII